MRLFNLPFVHKNNFSREKWNLTLMIIYSPGYTIRFDAIDTLLAAIKTRGQFKFHYVATSSSTYIDALSLASKKGKLVCVGVWGIAGCTPKVKITLDGTILGEKECTAAAIKFLSFGTGVSSVSLLDEYDSPFLLNLEFNESCLIELKRTAGADLVYLFMWYQED